MRTADGVVQVTLFRDFVEDHRYSMDAYANELGRALRAIPSDRFDFVDFTPTAPFTTDRDSILSTWKMRFARYLTYPAVARRQQRDINHILDHAYAHLLCTIDAHKTLVTVHDLIPMAANRGKIPGLRRYRPWLSEFSASFLRKARIVSADSENTKNDVMEFCRVADSRIRVIPPGLSCKFRVLSASNKLELRRKLGLPTREAFLILITGKQFYKNHGTSLRVLRELQQNGLCSASIVWLGNYAAKTDTDVVALGLQDAVQGIVPDGIETLVELYNAVDCLLFPSWYEGFGWPPLEAMACGIPVVCSGVASLPEVVGDAALVGGPADVSQLAGHILKIAQNDRLRDSLVRGGLARALQFSWEKHARDVRAVYLEMAS